MKNDIVKSDGPNNNFISNIVKNIEDKSMADIGTLGRKYLILIKKHLIKHKKNETLIYGKVIDAISLIELTDYFKNKINNLK